MFLPGEFLPCSEKQHVAEAPSSVEQAVDPAGAGRLGAQAPAMPDLPGAAFRTGTSGSSAAVPPPECYMT